MPVSARKLTAEDKPIWLELWQGYVAYYRAEIADDVTEVTWARLLDESSGVEGFGAADEGGALVGIVHYLFHPVTWSKQPRCYLEDLFTSKAARGKGAGRALIEAVYEEAKAKGSDQVYWLTEDYNKRAHYLYDKVASKTHFIKYQKNI